MSSPGFRVQREQIMAKQQEMENARLKNSGRAPKGSKDGLRPESPHSRRPRRPPVRKMVQPGRPKFEVNDKYKLLLLLPQRTFRHYYARKGKVCCVVVDVAAFSLACSSPIQRSTHEQLQGCFVVEVLLI